MPTSLELLTANRPDNLNSVRELLDRARREEIMYFPSPIDWRDEVLYFLLPDRFSDGQETGRPLLNRSQIVDLRHTPSRQDFNWKNWADSGKQWQGGTLQGIRGRLPYLKQLGITTIWVGPVFKQRVQVDSYHGYGIQDFLDVDRRFGTRQDLVELVQAAHNEQLKIILDIIVNHSGDNWGYVSPQAPLSAARNEPPFRPWPDFYGNPQNPDTNGWKMAWRNEAEQGFTIQASQLQPPHEGVWPKDFHSNESYTRAGKGSLGAGDIADPHAENKRTDFFALKDLALDNPSTLSFLAECFKYWIALTDCDGFRIDTVKHMALEETRNFCGAIREFADTIGKRNFF